MLSPEPLITISTAAALLLGMSLALVAVVVTTRRDSPILITITGVAVAVMLTAVVVVPVPLPPAVSFPLALLGSAVAVVGGNPFTRDVLRRATAGAVREGEHGGILLRTTREGDAAVREVLLGGTTIGYLERVAATVTILVGFPEGLAVVVALKGIGRFSELASSEARERFIIGTLASLVWACAVAATVRFAVW
ncbi:hypothetical protein [Microbacterium xanthum]|uniref:hypothetical protein n=1 Tax=Microbacterium xanthum TaxID=3079794 RepID=UPI002AD57CF9|nr:MULTISPECIES: hypothetical protein [unclassified Microbacterium]MDZ8171355.1 hypothetical protein [Microbacterium sp. KSW-48]MDZ8201850.1 hypothetical protein [Microbacterium sp. SSW1-59]